MIDYKKLTVTESEQIDTAFQLAIAYLEGKDLDSLISSRFVAETNAEDLKKFLDSLYDEIYMNAKF